MHVYIPVSKLSQQLGESLSQVQVLQGQSKQYGAMYEQCCRKIQELEDEKMMLQDEMLKTKLQVPKSYPNNHRHNQQYQKEAIVIEQEGVISSPLSKNRN